MGVSNKIKSVLKAKKMTQEQFAEAINKDFQQTRNALYRDTFQYNTIEQWLDKIGVDIVLVDRETGEIFK